MSRCIAGVERCGCIRGVYVLGDHDADAYKAAARWAKAGCSIETLLTTDLPVHFYCEEHRASSGPPWWPRVKRAMAKAAPR